MKRRAIPATVAAAATVAVALILAATTSGQVLETSPDPSIVGGGKANPQGYGFAVTLELKPYGFICTGSLIAPDRVLTAAHCVRRFKPRRMTVRAGSPWSRGKKRGERIRVRRVRIHPRYNPRKDRRDFAVITLRRDADAPVIELPTPRQSKRATRPEDKVRSAGWGTRNAYGYRLAARLKTAKEYVYPNRVCRRFFGREAYNAPTMICTLGKLIRRYGRTRYHYYATTCTGDSGGPLVANTPLGPRLIGVTSVGPVPCGAAGPSIYARVSAGLPFIRRAAGLARVSPAPG